MRRVFEMEFVTFFKLTRLSYCTLIWEVLAGLQPAFQMCDIHTPFQVNGPPVNVLMLL